MRARGPVPRAARVAAALREELDVESELMTGPSGSFEVAVNGRTVARKAGHDFPTEQELVDAVARALGP